MPLDLKDFNFGKLGSPNVDSELWFIKMKFLLKSKKLWSAIETAVTPESTPEEKETDESGLSVLALCVADHHLATVDRATSANGAWEALKTIYQSKTVASVQRTRREFNTVKLQTNETMTDYIARAQTLRARLEASGQSIDDETFIMTLLAGLPMGYNAVTTFIENTDPLPGLSDVQGMLLRTEEKLKTGQPKSGRRDNEDAAYNASSYKSRECHYCGKKGHYIRECRKRIANEKKAKLAGTKPPVSPPKQHVALAASEGISYSDTTWIVDSGSDRHITCNFGLLSETTPLEDCTIRWGNGSSSKAAAEGEVCLGYTPYSHLRVQMGSVLYVPEAQVNLLSVAQAGRQGVTFQFSSTSCRMLAADGDLVAVAYREGSAYVLRPNMVKHTNSFVGVSTKETPQLWHRRT
jgi:hypothetical protein